MSKLELFKLELDLIKDTRIKLFVEKMLNELPDYFWTTGASSTGKYHPSYACGDGGLVRHTRAAVRIAHEMLRMDMYTFLRQYEDLIYASLILHDGCKHGLKGSKYTVTDHPLVVGELIEKCASPEIEDFAKDISDAISSHMGQWNKDYKSGKEVLPLPKSKIQKFVHQADYLASRKCLEHNFDAMLSNR